MLTLDYLEQVAALLSVSLYIAPLVLHYPHSLTMRLPLVMVVMEATGVTAVLVALEESVVSEESLIKTPHFVPVTVAMVVTADLVATVVAVALVLAAIVLLSM